MLKKLILIIHVKSIVFIVKPHAPIFIRLYFVLLFFIKIKKDIWFDPC